MQPLVSILMPVYNTAPYLREAMDSMLSQTFTDFELIVLDDCSPDNAVEILDTYDDPRIVRYRGEHNVGLANVLNVGMDMARGKYIARMDSDDRSLPDRLQVQVAYLESHPEIDLCSCGMQLFGESDAVWVRSTDPERVKVEALFYSPILHASSVWRRERFDERGLRFRQEMVPAEDYDMWCRALAGGLQLVNIPEVLYEYRIRPGQATEDTQRTSAKDIEVRKGFLLQAFPACSEALVDRMARFKTLKKADEIKEVTKVIERENDSNRFFKPEVLHKALQSYYQKYLVEGLQEHFTLGDFFKLSLKNQMRWIGIDPYLMKNFRRINLKNTRR